MLSKIKIYLSLAIAGSVMLFLFVTKIKQSARNEMKNKSMKQTLKAIKTRKEDEKNISLKSKSVITDELRKNGWLRSD